MVRRAFNLLYREVRGLHEAAYLLGLFALFSQALALIRDRVFAHYFGAGATLDVYYAAFRIPDLIFVGIASLVSVYVLIPFLSERLLESKEKAREFLSSVFSFFALLIIGVSVVAFFLVPYLAEALFPGLKGGGTLDDLILLTRILLLQPILLGFSSLFASVTQVHHRFILYATSPLFYNLGIISGAIFLFPVFGIAGLGMGVVLGAFFHLAIQLPFLFEERLSPLLKVPDFKLIGEVFALSLPRTIALSAGQITLLFLVAFASLLQPGSIAIFSFSYNLQSVPLMVIGASYSVAAFPTLARLFSEGDRERFFLHVSTALRHILFWSLPIIVLFIVLRAQIVRVILGSGAFDWDDTRLVAAGLALFVISLAAQSVVLLLARGYYAAGNTMKPLVVNVLSSFVSLLSAYLLMKVFLSNDAWREFFEVFLRVEGIPGTAVLMLPLGYSIGMTLNAVILFALFRQDFKRRSLVVLSSLWRSALAALLAGIVSYATLRVLDGFLDLNTFVGIFTQGFTAGVLGLISGGWLLYLVESKEFKEAFDSVKGRFWKRNTIAGHDQEL
ncbi:MAG: lipid II flippase MurJ [Candidatus Paceibacterota bacterium]